MHHKFGGKAKRHRQTNPTQKKKQHTHTLCGLFKKHINASITFHLMLYFFEYYKYVSENYFYKNIKAIKK